MHTLEKGTTKTLKGCLQNEAQTHSLTEDSRLTTALKRQHEARGAAGLPVRPIFLKLSCFFHDPEDVGNLISGSSAFTKTSLNIRKFTVHILLKHGLETFEHYFTSV